MLVEFWSCILCVVVIQGKLLSTELILLPSLPDPWGQVFQTASERIETEGLSALRALSTCLSRSVLSSDDEDLLDSFLRGILQGNHHQSSIHIYKGWGGIVVRMLSKDLGDQI